MKSRNYNIDHPIVVVIREKEIVIETTDGKEIASLYIDTSEEDKSLFEKGVQPTKSFYLGFTPSKQCDSAMKDVAFVQID